MINKVKSIRRVFLEKTRIKAAFKRDCKKYMLWQYNNPKLNSSNVFEAKILRSAHILEKGMSLSNPKPKFGVQKANELLDLVDGYVEFGYDITKSSAILNSLAVLNEYLLFHKEHGFSPSKVVSRFEKYSHYVSPNYKEYGIRKILLKELNQSIHSEFPEFFRSRHSVRQFSDTPISISEIETVVDLAMRAPSACNRQSCRIYFYNSPETNKKLSEYIAGNTGFSDEVKNYLIITSDISAFYDSFERNQTYIDGGIFTMALTEALHYYGIGSCILQMGETIERDENIRKICGNIPSNEKIIVFIAIGHYKEEFSYALSHRKSVKDVLIIK